MSNNNCSGAAFGLALCTTALASCSVKDNQSGQATSSIPEVDSAWKSGTERQLRDAYRR